MGKDNDNPKTTSDKEQVENKTVVKEPGDVTPKLAEAQAVLDAEEGEIEASIEKQKLKKDTNIAPDLKELKKEQVKKKKEIKQKEAEVKEAVKETKEVKTEKAVIPSKFEGKTEEEKNKIYQDMEKSHTQISQKNKEMEQKITEYGEIDSKIKEIEKQSIVSQQKVTPVKLPKYPTSELYYEDPEKYNQQVKIYNDARFDAMVQQVYGQNWEVQKKSAISGLKDRTKDDIVPFTDVEKEVESRLRKNPAIKQKYGVNASEAVYNQVRNEMIPQKVKDKEEAAVEQAKKELKEEAKETKEAQVMSSDITTQSRGSKPVDLEKMLDEGDNPEEVIKTYKKKHKIDFQF